MPAIRHKLFAAIAMSLASTAAHAGEFAEFRPIGFSADGKVFAFEEFGVQDGSGFAFANRFFIDTTDDSFLPGSTVRVVLGRRDPLGRRRPRRGAGPGGIAGSPA